MGEGGDKEVSVLAQPILQDPGVFVRFPHRQQRITTQHTPARRTKAGTDTLLGQLGGLQALKVLARVGDVQQCCGSSYVGKGGYREEV